MSAINPIRGVSHAVAWLNRMAEDDGLARHARALLAELDRLRGLVSAQYTCIVCGGELLPDLVDRPPFCAESKCELDIGLRDVENDDGNPADHDWHRTDEQWREIAGQIEAICERSLTYTKAKP